MIGEMLNQSKSVSEVAVQLSKNCDPMTSGRNVVLNIWERIKSWGIGDGLLNCSLLLSVCLHILNFQVFLIHKKFKFQF